jgi:hypothetical protein
MRRARLGVLVTSAILLAGGPATAGALAREGPAGQQQALAADVDALNARLASRPDRGQVIADAERLAAGYRGLGPAARGFNASEIARHRRLTRDAFSWLSRASVLYSGDPAVTRALMATYGVLGDFYGHHRSLYALAGPVAYARANRLARGLSLAGGAYGVEDAELQRLAVSWASVGYLNPGYYWWWWRPADNLPDEPTYSEPEAPPVHFEPVPLPEVDASMLTAEQAETWRDVRARFVTTASRVHEARVALEQLSSRLRAKNMGLNAQDAAAALMMQGFLEDAADLIRQHRFEPAAEALTRADYQRRKLKSVTGQ